MIGCTIKQFRITAELGRGGMGVVYRAQDTKLDREVALKFLPPHLTADPTARSRFIHEAKAASSLEHPAICTIHEIGETDDRQTFMVMPCYEGETLQDRIARGPLPVEEAVAIFRQVAQGLGKAHSQGIVHRDIKPANIFLTSDGQAVILDFGLAKLAGQTLLTQEGTTLGTVTYMSPEQAQGEEAGADSDLWSLGAVLFEMLAGQPPFSGEHPQAVIYAIGHLDPTPLPDFRKDVPEEVNDLVQGLLQKDRGKRKAEAEFLLPPFLDGLTVNLGSSAPGSGRVLGSWVGPAVVLAVLMVVLSAWIFTKMGDGPIDSIAVLPFEDLSANKDQEYLSDGMTDQLISRLGTVGVFNKVISRRSVMRYKDNPKPMDEIARELDVRALVEGTIVFSGDRARVTATLIDAGTEMQLWSDSFDESVVDILDLQNRVVRAIVAAIDRTLSPEVQSHLTGDRKVDPRAYRAYLRGLQLLYAWEEDDLKQIEKSFLESIAADSTYAPPYAGLAEFHVQRTHTHNGIPPADAVPKANKYLAKAFELDDSLAEAYMTQGHLRWEHEFKFKEAEDSFKRALVLNPNLAWAHLLYSYYLTSVSRNEEAADEAMKAVALDPFTAIPYAVYEPLRNAGRFDQALSLVEEYERLNPEFLGWRPRIFIYAQRDEWSRMAHYLEDLVGQEMKPDTKRGIMEHLAKAYHYLGKPDESRAILVELEFSAESPVDHLILAKDFARIGDIDRARTHFSEYENWEEASPVNQVGYYTALGDLDRAFELLEQGYDLRINWMTRLGYTVVNPLYGISGLKEDPRFEPLLKKIGIRE